MISLQRLANNLRDAEIEFNLNFRKGKQQAMMICFVLASALMGVAGHSNVDWMAILATVLIGAGLAIPLIWLPEIYLLAKFTNGNDSNPPERMYH
jgi:hypothetical protein